MLYQPVESQGNLFMSPVEVKSHNFCRFTETAAGLSAVKGHLLSACFRTLLSSVFTSLHYTAIRRTQHVRAIIDPLFSDSQINLVIFLSMMVHESYFIVDLK